MYFADCSFPKINRSKYFNLIYIKSFTLALICRFYTIYFKTPIWFTGGTYKKLAPPYELLQQYKENNNSEFYIQYYKKNVLQRLNPSQVVDELTSNGPVVLLCYEKDDFCHRHLVSEWLNENGFVCREW